MPAETRRIPVAIPDLRGLEREYVDDAIASSWISSTGAYLTRFEEEFAEACTVERALATSNGTVAIHLALAALGVGPGDEVIVPSFTYIATANAVTYTGATPVFVDVDPETWCIDPAAVEAAVTERTVGVIPVHLYGHPADMVRLRSIADQRGLWLVEDAAEAHFATCHGATVGSLGDIATFSFYGNKILTSGEGGAVTTGSNELAERMYLLRGQGMDPERRYWFPIVGYNYRLTNLAGALLCAQMARREAIVADRQRIFDIYEGELADVPGVGLQPVAAWARRAPWLCSITVEEGASVDRDGLMAQLLERGIDTRPFFVPLHHLPPYVDARVDGTMEVTDRLGASGVNLPTYGTMDDDDARYVAHAVRDILHG